MTSLKFVPRPTWPRRVLYTGTWQRGTFWWEMKRCWRSRTLDSPKKELTWRRAPGRSLCGGCPLRPCETDYTPQSVTCMYWTWVSHFKAPSARIPFHSKIFFDAFSPSVPHTKTMKRCNRFHWKWRFFKTVPKVDAWNARRKRCVFKLVWTGDSKNAWVMSVQKTVPWHRSQSTWRIMQYGTTLTYFVYFSLLLITLQMGLWYRLMGNLYSW